MIVHHAAGLSVVADICKNGENVSPEGIENRIGCSRLVKEILVYAKNDAIFAEIYPDYELAEQTGVTDIKKALEDKGVKI